MLKRLQPKSYIFHGDGGAVDGAYILEYLLFLSRHTGLEPHQLFDVFIGESISSFFVGALNTHHPTDPRRALVNIEELRDLFHEKAADFLPYKGWRGLRKVLLATSKKYIDQNRMKGELQACFGERQLRESIKATLITSQKIFPGPKEPYIFTYIPEGLLADTSFPIPSLVESGSIPITEACLAATAHGIFAASHEVKQTGTVHSDFGAVGNRAAEILNLSSRMHSGIQPVYCFFSTGRPSAFQTKKDIDRTDRAGLFSLRKFSFAQEGSKAEASHAQRHSLRAVFGPENVHVIEMDMSTPPKGIAHFPNLLDTRPQAMSLRAQAAAAFIDAHRVMLVRLADAMGENYHMKHGAVEPTPIVPRLEAFLRLPPPVPSGAPAPTPAAA